MSRSLYITKELYEDLSSLTRAYLTSDGKAEIFNPRPLSCGLDLQPQESLQDQIRRILRVELSRQVSQQGHESFEEANDFDVDDDFDLEPSSQYECLREEYLDPVASAKPDPVESAPSETSSANESHSPEGVDDNDPETPA